MIEIILSNQFRKDIKLAKKRGLNITLLETVVNMLANEKKLPDKYRDHQLVGKYKNFRECHIQPDWLLIYQIDKSILSLLLLRTGTHTDLF